MTQVKPGTQVKVHYTGTFDDGTEFDSSEGKPPLEFTCGENQVIPGFEEAVAGMSVGEKKSFRVEPDKGYGEYDEQQQVVVERSMLPEELELAEGVQLQVETQSGEPVIVQVTNVAEDKVTLDANHPFAGKVLNFVLEVVEVN
ncbi:MAG: peptidylprolyl isomerase [Desulfuromonadaceae bacterium]|nr:peptidylprolyl isomerase [Desulfuromonadaceae bacterium]